MILIGKCSVKAAGGGWFPLFNEILRGAVQKKLTILAEMSLKAFSPTSPPGLNGHTEKILFVFSSCIIFFFGGRGRGGMRVMAFNSSTEALYLFVTFGKLE